MRPFKRIAVALLAAVLANTCEAATWIADDLGGPLGDYIVRFSKLSRSGERIVIDGRCYSACTAVIGLIPPARLCVTRQAVFGFHAAMAPDQWGRLIVDQAATRLLYNIYPKSVRAWLTRNGGLESEMIYLRGAELAKFYALCR
jgi:hypothetical protein